jgi:hypothetical protein
VGVVIPLPFDVTAALVDAGKATGWLVLMGWLAFLTLLPVLIKVGRRG